MTDEEIWVFWSNKKTPADCKTRVWLKKSSSPDTKKSLVKIRIATGVSVYMYIV